MKKFYVMVIAILICGAAIGQNSLTFPSGKVLDQKNIAKIKVHQKSTDTKNPSRWYNYGEAMDIMMGGIGTYAGNILFPDSTTKVVYNGGVLAGPWIHKTAETFDPTTIIFNDQMSFPGELALNYNSVYTLDSIEFWGLYSRGHKTLTAVDTLLIEVAIVSFPGAFSYFGPSSAVSINLATDTTMFVDLAYTQSTNSFGVMPHTHYKVLLNAASAVDTLPNGVNHFSVAPNLTVNAGEHFCVSYSFIPGYTWIHNVDSMSALNTMRFLSMDENPGNFPAYTKHDWNASYILPQDVRYDQAGGWNGSYIPSFAYMGGSTNQYSYVHHAAYYKCTGVSGYSILTSVPETNTSETLLGNAYPNPVNGSSITIPVNSNDDKAMLIITDVVGQQLMQFNQISDKQVVVNTADLGAGLYFYTLQSGKTSITKRFSVIK